MHANSPETAVCWLLELGTAKRNPSNQSSLNYDRYTSSLSSTGDWKSKCSGLEKFRTSANQDCFVLQCYLLLKVNTAKEIFNVKLLCLLSSYSLLFPHLDNVRTHFVRQRLCGSSLQLLKKISKRRPRADKTKIVLIMKFACKLRFEPINIQILEKNRLCKQWTLMFP